MFYSSFSFFTGIGRGIAIQLVHCGAKVIAISRTQEDLDSLKKEVFLSLNVSCHGSLKFGPLSIYHFSGLITESSQWHVYIGNIVVYLKEFYKFKRPNFRLLDYVYSGNQKIKSCQHLTLLQTGIWKNSEYCILRHFISICTVCGDKHQSSCQKCIIILKVFTAAKRPPF